MAALNRAFRGVDRPTDVLAFPAEGPAGGGPGRPARASRRAPVAPAGGGPYLGDLAISVETARRQAARRGHPLEREAAVLLIHGILHLVGYDHRTPGQRRRMWRLQSRLLRDHAGPLPLPGRSRKRA